MRLGRALGIPIKPRELPEVLETLDPGNAKFVTYEHFLAYAALFLHHKDAADDQGRGSVYAFHG